MQRLARGHRGLQFGAGDIAQAHLQGVTLDRAADGIRLGRQLVADGRANEIAAVAIEPFLNQKVDPPQVHMAQVDGDLLVVEQLQRFLCHRLSSMWMVYGGIVSHVKGPLSYGSDVIGWNRSMRQPGHKFCIFTGTSRGILVLQGRILPVRSGGQTESIMTIARTPPAFGPARASQRECGR